jgi:hypothetical protein
LEKDFTNEEDRLASGDTELDGFNPGESFAKRGRDGGINYKNWQYLNYKPGMNYMPPGLKTQTAQEVLQDIRNTGANYSWNNEAQMRCFNNDAYGMTRNLNKQLADAGMETGPQYIMALFSPDATATTAYEEYLHITEALVRRNMPTTTEAEGVEEEIRVEYQVMQNAQYLRKNSEEWKNLSRNRKNYIIKLTKLLGGSLPDDLKPYRNDPPKPSTIP